MKQIVTFLTLLLLLGACQSTEPGTGDETVVLVSFDGFRWDYPHLYPTPNFDRMAGNGVKAERLIASFPTKTFPNHYTLVTGLYPDHHGLIANTFHDPVRDVVYRIRDRQKVQDAWFYGGEPIWVTAEKQGVISASYYWVGSTAPIGGIRPAYYKEYDQSVSFDDRIDTVLQWLTLPENRRPRLVTLYFHEPDAVGHQYGPESQETGRVIGEMDRLLGELRKGIGSLPHSDRVNLIVLSDHGMGAIHPNRYVNIYEHADSGYILDQLGGSPGLLLDIKDGWEDSVAAWLDPVEGIAAWTGEKVPSELHYGTHERFPDVLVLADSSWSVGTVDDPSGYTGGAHGYDSRNTDMHAIFYAEGPAFREHSVHPPFENVQVYGIIAYILGLEPAPTDGDISAVEDLFAAPVAE